MVAKGWTVDAEVTNPELQHTANQMGVAICLALLVDAEMQEILVSSWRPPVLTIPLLPGSQKTVIEE